MAILKEYKIVGLLKIVYKEKSTRTCPFGQSWKSYWFNERLFEKNREKKFEKKKKNGEWQESSAGFSEGNAWSLN